MKQQFFITGTDTDVGKTCIASALLYKARQTGKSTAAIKPVAAGALQTDDGLRNEDALALLQQCSIDLSYAQINPVCLEPAIAPHIAAEQAGKNISVSRLTGFCRGVAMAGADFMLVEGAGGWRVPLNSRETLADLARELQYPVIMVVGMKLGCLNHALLTLEAIQRDGLALAGWVANCIDPEMVVLEDNITSLQQRLPAPCLGVIPYTGQVSPEVLATHLADSFFTP